MLIKNIEIPKPVLEETVATIMGMAQLVEDRIHGRSDSDDSEARIPHPNVTGCNASHDPRHSRAV